MEIRLNKDLQKMQDNLAFGFNLRQTICAAIGVVAGVATYFFATRNGLNTEVASWICVAVVAPFAALGFVTINGMTFERLVIAWIKQYLLCPQRVLFHLENDFYIRDKSKIEKAEAMEAKRND